MMLVDTGPLVAMIDRRDTNHDLCRAVVMDLTGQLLTTVPVLTEGMYLLGVIAGFRAQQRLWELHFRGALALHATTDAEMKRSFELMSKYSDRPMDFADATQVAAADALGTNRIFTLDDDFRMYRLPGRKSFQLIPG